jgi:hypothetical protein
MHARPTQERCVKTAMKRWRALRGGCPADDHEAQTGHSSASLAAPQTSANLETAPDDVLICIFLKLELHDRFRLGGANRKLRRVFKLPDVWRRVDFAGRGFLSALFHRAFRVGHMAVEQIVIHSAELSDPSFDAVDDVAGTPPRYNAVIFSERFRRVITRWLFCVARSSHPRYVVVSCEGTRALQRVAFTHACVCCDWRRV